MIEIINHNNTHTVTKPSKASTFVDDDSSSASTHPDDSTTTLIGSKTTMKPIKKDVSKSKIKEYLSKSKKKLKGSTSDKNQVITIYGTSSNVDDKKEKVEDSSKKDKAGSKKSKLGVKSILKKFGSKLKISKKRVSAEPKKKPVLEKSKLEKKRKEAFIKRKKLQEDLFIKSLEHLKYSVSQPPQFRKDKIERTSAPHRRKSSSKPLQSEKRDYYKHPKKLDIRYSNSAPDPTSVPANQKRETPSPVYKTSPSLKPIEDKIEKWDEVFSPSTVSTSKVTFKSEVHYKSISKDDDTQSKETSQKNLKYGDDKHSKEPSFTKPHEKRTRQEEGEKARERVRTAIISRPLPALPSRRTSVLSDLPGEYQKTSSAEEKTKHSSSRKISYGHDENEDTEEDKHQSKLEKKNNHFSEYGSKYRSLNKSVTIDQSQKDSKKFSNFSEHKSFKDKKKTYKTPAKNDKLDKTYEAIGEKQFISSSDGQKSKKMYETSMGRQAFDDQMTSIDTSTQQRTSVVYTASSNDTDTSHKMWTKASKTPAKTSLVKSIHTDQYENFYEEDIDSEKKATPAGQSVSDEITTPSKQKMSEERKAQSELKSSRVSEAVSRRTEYDTSNQRTSKDNLPSTEQFMSTTVVSDKHSDSLTEPTQQRATSSKEKGGSLDTLKKLNTNFKQLPESYKKDFDSEPEETQKSYEENSTTIGQSTRQALTSTTIDTSTPVTTYSKSPEFTTSEQDKTTGSYENYSVSTSQPEETTTLLKASSSEKKSESSSDPYFKDVHQTSKEETAGKKSKRSLYAYENEKEEREIKIKKDKNREEKDYGSEERKSKEIKKTYDHPRKKDTIYEYVKNRDEKENKNYGEINKFNRIYEKTENTGEKKNKKNDKEVRPVHDYVKQKGEQENEKYKKAPIYGQIKNKRIKESEKYEKNENSYQIYDPSRKNDPIEDYSDKYLSRRDLDVLEDGEETDEYVKNKDEEENYAKDKKSYKEKESEKYIKKKNKSEKIEQIYDYSRQKQDVQDALDQRRNGRDSYVFEDEEKTEFKNKREKSKTIESEHIYDQYHQKSNLDNVHQSGKESKYKRRKDLYAMKDISEGKEESSEYPIYEQVKNIDSRKNEKFKKSHVYEQLETPENKENEKYKKGSKHVYGEKKDADRKEIEKYEKDRDGEKKEEFKDDQIYKYKNNKNKKETDKPMDKRNLKENEYVYDKPRKSAHIEDYLDKNKSKRDYYVLEEGKNFDEEYTKKIFGNSGKNDKNFEIEKNKLMEKENVYDEPRKKSRVSDIHRSSERDKYKSRRDYYALEDEDDEEVEKNEKKKGVKKDREEAKGKYMIVENKSMKNKGIYDHPRKKENIYDQVKSKNKKNDDLNHIYDEVKSKDKKDNEAKGKAKYIREIEQLYDNFHRNHDIKDQLDENKSEKDYNMLEDGKKINEKYTKQLYGNNRDKNEKFEKEKSKSKENEHIYVQPRKKSTTAAVYQTGTKDTHKRSKEDNVLEGGNGNKGKNEEWHENHKIGKGEKENEKVEKDNVLTSLYHENEKDAKEKSKIGEKKLQEKVNKELDKKHTTGKDKKCKSKKALDEGSGDIYYSATDTFQTDSMDDKRRPTIYYSANDTFQTDDTRVKKDNTTISGPTSDGKEKFMTEISTFDNLKAKKSGKQKKSLNKSLYFMSLMDQRDLHNKQNKRSEQYIHNKKVNRSLELKKRFSHPAKDFQTKSILREKLKKERKEFNKRSTDKSGSTQIKYTPNSRDQEVLQSYTNIDPTRSCSDIAVATTDASNLPTEPSVPTKTFEGQVSRGSRQAGGHNERLREDNEMEQRVDMEIKQLLNNRVDKQSKNRGLVIKRPKTTEFNVKQSKGTEGKRINSVGMLQKEKKSKQSLSKKDGESPKEKILAIGKMTSNLEKINSKKTEAKGFRDILRKKQENEVAQKKTTEQWKTSAGNKGAYGDQKKAAEVSVKRKSDAKPEMKGMGNVLKNEVRGTKSNKEKHLAQPLTRPFYMHKKVPKKKKF